MWKVKEGEGLRDKKTGAWKQKTLKTGTLLECLVWLTNRPGPDHKVEAFFVESRKDPALSYFFAKQDRILDFKSTTGEVEEAEKFRATFEEALWQSRKETK
jgi:hypothetical protein